MCPVRGQMEAGCLGTSASHPLQPGMDGGFAAVIQVRFSSCWWSFKPHFQVSVLQEWLLNFESFFLSWYENTFLVCGLTLAARRCREGPFRVCRLNDRDVSLSGGILLCLSLFSADKLSARTGTCPGRLYCCWRDRNLLSVSGTWGVSDTKRQSDSFCSWMAKCLSLMQ